MRTWTTAALGAFFSPFIIMFHISSYGGVSSTDKVIRGESHRTIEEGSSNRMMRFSNLHDQLPTPWADRQGSRLTFPLCKSIRPSSHATLYTVQVV